MTKRLMVFLDPAPVDVDGPEPDGFLEWHEWVRAQVRAKRIQRRHTCGRYWWPHTGRCRHCEASTQQTGDSP